ncbi:hypothetical protein CC80DRAFT_585679 [Byssothecium circinans]|uniref:BTB domain-containing protein n=1 Tax=Byssothecium circinans TaxID=147558 RepID=A0A6A5U330_9PLEO|nr:hypothetical protein CC80DRAFT_585679 [Byssothecium circinans]
MTRIAHDVHSGADTIIILKNPLAGSKVWKDLDADDHVEKPVLESDSNTDQPSIAEPSSEEVVPEASEETVDQQPVAEESSEEEEGEEQEVHYHVSSILLKTASPKFASMLSGEIWKEGIRNEEDGCYYILVEKWDAEAFLILLNVLHLRNRQVPRSVSLSMLTKIAVLADYFTCTEAIELSTEIWVKDLKDTTPIPSNYCQNLILWMCITWVLRLPQEFTQATGIAIRQRTLAGLPTLDLPIIGFVDKLATARVQAIDAIISQLHDLLDKYSDANYSCSCDFYSFECSSILYGALTKGMNQLGLLLPYPVAPFSGTSYQDLHERPFKIKSPNLSHPSKEKYKAPHFCSLKVQVRGVINRVRRSVNGLDLEDFGRTLSADVSITNEKVSARASI